MKATRNNGENLRRRNDEWTSDEEASRRHRLGSPKFARDVKTDASSYGRSFPAFGDMLARSTTETPSRVGLIMIDGATDRAPSDRTVLPPCLRGPRVPDQRAVA